MNRRGFIFSGLVAGSGFLSVFAVQIFGSIFRIESRHITVESHVRSKDVKSMLGIFERENFQIYQDYRAALKSAQLEGRLLSRKIVLIEDDHMTLRFAWRSVADYDAYLRDPRVSRFVNGLKHNSIALSESSPTAWKS